MRAFLFQARGATAIEYALIAGLISLAILGGLANLGGQMEALFARIASAMP